MLACPARAALASRGASTQEIALYGGWLTGDGILSGLVSLSASYRFAQHWAARVTWNRVVTRYSRDTDVLMRGIGYRF